MSLASPFVTMQTDPKAKALELRRQGLSYEHIAARIGRCAMTVYYWINGRPSQAKGMRLAD